MITTATILIDETRERLGVDSQPRMEESVRACYVTYDQRMLIKRLLDQEEERVRANTFNLAGTLLT